MHTRGTNADRAKNRRGNRAYDLLLDESEAPILSCHREGMTDAEIAEALHQ